MDLIKSYDFFNPNTVTERIHIVGCGSVGSTLAENMVRCGLTKITLWDFDKVESKNIVNQMFRDSDIGSMKVDALKKILVEINPDAEATIKTKPQGWQGENLAGYIFLAVDNIELRKEFCEQHKDNAMVKAVFDFRTMLESAQHYAADWSSPKLKDALLASMNFSHEEAADETPVSACGVTLGVATTVRLICALGVNNFIRFVKTGELKKFVQIDGFSFCLDAF